MGTIFIEDAHNESKYHGFRFSMARMSDGLEGWEYNQFITAVEGEEPSVPFYREWVSAEETYYKDEFSRAKKVGTKWVVGSRVYVWRNQDNRLGMIVGQYKNEVLLAYRMPQGRLFFNQIKRYNEDALTDSSNSRDYITVSAAKPPKKWAKEIAETIADDCV